jgi:GntR family transcriptional regulator
MNVDRAADWPLSAQLAQLLRRSIRSGEFAAGSRVPSENELADEYDVSRDTAQRALAMLVGERMITRRRGVGSIVAAVDQVTEVRVAPGGRISARLPTTAESAAARAGSWMPILSVTEPGRPEQLFAADRVVLVIPALGTDAAAGSLGR